MDRTDEVSSKYCFEVVDRTDEVVYRDEHLFINVSGRGGKDLAAIADY
ncbi:chlorohydrolase [Streptococcus pneumoniae]|nr:chlorohydrolase [Streptococcus pneumoniae]